MSDLIGRGPMAIPTSIARKPDSTASLPQQLQQAQAFGHRLQQFQVQAKSADSRRMASPGWHLRTLSQAGQPLAIQRQVDAAQLQSASSEQSSASAPPVQFFITSLIGALISPILKILFSGGGSGGGDGGGAEESGGGGADF